MATLLHHIQPWMQKSISESEGRMERKMQWKIAEVHQQLDAFELRVLAYPAPPVDVRLFRLQPTVFVQTSTRS